MTRPHHMKNTPIAIARQCPAMSPADIHINGMVVLSISWVSSWKCLKGFVYFLEDPATGIAWLVKMWPFDDAIVKALFLNSL